jgi:hypothetical protein
MPGTPRSRRESDPPNDAAAGGTTDWNSAALGADDSGVTPPDKLSKDCHENSALSSGAISWVDESDDMTDGKGGGVCDCLC